MTLAYALTAHKCQGGTLERVIVDFRVTANNKVFIDRGSFYVAITRVKSANSLFLRSFDKSFIKVHSKVEYEIETRRKFKSYQFKKIYLDEKIFDKDTEFRVGYFNINGLLDGYHAEYLNNDQNLLNLDILTLAETHLTEQINNETISQLLSNWKIVYRMDAGDSKKHMGLLMISPLNISTPNILYFSPFRVQKNRQTHIQGLISEIDCQSIAFLYCRVTPTNAEATHIFNSTKNVEYVMGDLNLNPQDIEQETKLAIIRGEDKMSLLNEITTKNNKQLDHVLGRINESTSIYATSYKNFISDHKAITLRISEKHTRFIPDPRITQIR